jgi:hypothetical protein
MTLPYTSNLRHDRNCTPPDEVVAVYRRLAKLDGIVMLL